MHATPWPFSRLLPLGCAQGPSWASLSRRYGPLAIGSMPIEPTADRADCRRQSEPEVPFCPPRATCPPRDTCFATCLSPTSYGVPQQRHAPCHGASATRPSTLLTLTSNRNRFCPPFPTFCHVFLVAGHVRALLSAAHPPRNAPPSASPDFPLSLSHTPSPLTLTFAACFERPVPILSLCR